MLFRKVLSAGYWREVGKRAKGVNQRRAAIAFVTEDLVGFHSADVLVVNASLRAIRSGGTAAKLLLNLHDDGVSIYNCENLHAKVLLLDDTAVIGSGNMSDMSSRAAGGWQEAGLITNDAVCVAGVASFIEQLARPKALLKRKRLVALTKIKVKRQSSRSKGRLTKRGVRVQQLGNRTWITGLRAVEISQEEERQAEKAKRELDGETEYMRYPTATNFAKAVRPGDSVIVIWKPQKNSRATVFRLTPVLLKHRVRRNALIHYREARGKYSEISWTKFQTLLKGVGYRRQVKPRSTQLVPIELADALAKGWNAVARS
jgi:hypothetical protein